ncbi:ACRO protein, partial [Prunella fulvescens]|nr:ACRO protein [Prunella fulvescens]
LASSHGTARNVDVPSGTWPGIASIQVTLENGTWHMCSGALIHPQWVLTVARCFMEHENTSKWKVLIGATDLAKPGPKAQKRHIKKVVKHQAYRTKAGRNNIALLELDRPVECSDYIQLACLPDSSLRVSELKTCYIAGWR